MTAERAKVFARALDNTSRGLSWSDRIEAALDAYEADAWVPVTDDLSTRPEARVQVMVLVDGKQRFGMWNGPGTGYGWCVDGWPSSAKPTHWRLLPPGPRT